MSAQTGNQPGAPALLRGIDRIFGAALWLYPRAWRDAVGEPMRDALRDQLREACRSGPLALLWALVAALLDQTLAASEQQAQALGMRPVRLRVVYVAAIVLAGVVFVQRVPIGLAYGDWMAQRAAFRDQAQAEAQGAAYEALLARAAQAVPPSASPDQQAVAASLE